MSKYRVGGKSKNDNRVDSFIWHLGVYVYFTFDSKINEFERKKIRKKMKKFQKPKSCRQLP